MTQTKTTRADDVFQSQLLLRGAKNAGFFPFLPEHIVALVEDIARRVAIEQATIDIESVQTPGPIPMPVNAPVVAPLSDAVEALIEAARNAIEMFRCHPAYGYTQASRCNVEDLESAIAAVRAASPWRDVNDHAENGKVLLASTVHNHYCVTLADGGHALGTEGYTHFMPIPPLPKENNHAE
jgi:hypothetical protein